MNDGCGNWNETKQEILACREAVNRDFSFVEDYYNFIAKDCLTLSTISDMTHFYGQPWLLEDELRYSLMEEETFN